MEKYNNLIQLDLSNVNRYSYSKLNTFDTCPSLYYKTYIEGNRGKNNGFALAGSIAHNIVDDFYKGKYTDFELPDIFAEKWETDFLGKGYNVILMSPKFKKNLTENYKNSFNKYFSNFRAYDNCKIIGTEIRFLFLLKNRNKEILYEGVIDGLGIDSDGEYAIWDSKSKGAFKNKSELNNYLVQLYSYSLYTKYIYKKYPKTLNFNQFRLEGEKRVATEIFDIKKYNETIDWIFSTVEKIENEKLWLPTCNEFFALNLCNHRDTCESNIFRRQ